MHLSLFRGALAALLFVPVGLACANVPGDLNGDGKVNVADATTALQMSVGLLTPTADQLLAGDVSPVAADGTYGDKKIAVGDAIRILQFSVGLIPSADFPGKQSINAPTATQGVALPSIQSVPVKTDFTYNVQLNAGYRLHGTLLGSKAAAVTGEAVTILDSKGAQVVTASVNGSGEYEVGVPAGTYQIDYSPHLTTGSDLPPGFPPGFPGSGPGPGGLNGSSGARPLQFPGLGATVNLNIPTGVILTVNADMQQDVTRPALPTLFTISGKINGAPAGAQPPYNLSFEQLQDANGNTVVGAPSASATYFTPDQTYSVQLPAGTYAAKVLVPGADSSAITLQVDTIHVTGTIPFDLTLPPLFTLSGSATLNGSPFGNVNPTVSTLQTGTQISGSLVSLGPVGTNGAYQLGLTSGTYDVRVGFEASATATNGGQWSFTVPGIDVPGDKTENLQVPALPTGQATLSGKVLGPDGAAITKGTVFFTSQGLDGADPHLVFSISAALSATGDYTVTLPTGAYLALVDPDMGIALASPPVPVANGG